MQKENYKVLIIIPAYNEEASVARVVEEIKEYHPEYDTLVINDCSKDNTRNVLINNEINYLDLPINLGIGGGVQTGYIYASQNHYDIAVQMDGDGQHCASELETLLNPIIIDEADASIGSRFIKKEGFQSSMLRRIGIKYLCFLIKLCSGIAVSDCTSGFRAVNKKYIDYFANEYAEDYPEPEAIIRIAASGGRIKEVPVVMRAREDGKSSIGGLRAVFYMIKVTCAIIIARISSSNV